MNRRHSRRLAAVSMAVAVAVVTSCLSGCGGDGRGRLTLRSTTDTGVFLSGRFDTALYSLDGPDHATLVLLAGPVEDPTQAVTMRLFWRPRGGRTPLEPSATNVTIHHLVFAHGEGAAEAGLYSGAGFLRPRGELGENTLRLHLRESVLRLKDRSAGFVDPLGQAVLQGELRAVRDDAAVQEVIRRLNVLARERLGYPSLVRGEGQEDLPGAAGG